ncbi:serine/threonine-protein kinase [Tenggerimyces flavus]|uniref:Protein kinase domain-containing protein n=1 Tax=Tenggerimyces flavus TaxID=1708749 RepID=A0ABV7Y7B6_9ACTN|nr:hypothetical protein [Tenggerimyces flavus]MBM7785061.1 serine/threonine protein kinase [Tenggerimyces flavus]
MTADLRTLVGVVPAVLDERDHELDQLARKWNVEGWRDVLLGIPPDSGTFTAQLELPWDRVITALTGWRARLADRERGELGSLNGFAGLLLLTLLALRHSERQRSPWADEGPDHDCTLLCERLVKDPDVQDALRELYAPAEPNAEWDAIKVRSLTFHRHGTTSFLLRGMPTERRAGELKPLALKCIVYPFLRIPTIARATKGYATTYELPLDVEADHLVGVWASSDSWLLMDFIDGQTLAELLAAQANGPANVGKARLDLARLRTIGDELFSALADLEACELEHGDLSPSNILVVEVEGTRRLRLVDLGVNFLYLHNLPGRDGADAAYVAPEIRALSRQVDPGAAVEERSRTHGKPSGDLYSLGQLLILLGCGRLSSDGTVPDVFYAEAPLLARFIEDLIDRDPARRLLIFRPSDSTYESLRQDFLEELDAVAAAKSEGANPHGVSWWRGMADLFTPLSGALGRQLRLWRKRRSQGLWRDPTRSFGVRRLLVWSTLATLTWGLCSVLVLMWTYRSAGLSWDNLIVVALQRLSGAAPDVFPIIDQLRAPGYAIPEGIAPVALGILALSMTLVGVKYYQSLFASVTPWPLRWGSSALSWYGMVAEVAMRVPAFALSLLTLAGLLVQPRLWLLLTAIGMTVVTAINWLTSSFALTVLAKARADGLSTVPAQVPGLALFASWIPGNLLYAVILWAVGILLYLGVLRDAMFYVVVITFLNVVQLYLVKCGRQGPPIRAGLARASVTAERLRLVRSALPS